MPKAIDMQPSEQTEPSGNLGRPKQTLSLPVGEARPSHYTVLVVHHNASTLQLTAAMLRNFGYHVTTACDSAQALSYFGQKHFDLVFSDLDMPLLDGYYLAHLIKKRRSQTKVVLMTCRCQAELVDLISEGTIDGWLFKPFNIHQISDLFAEIGFEAEPPACQRRL